MKTILDLQEQPLANALQPTKEAALKAQRYPLKLVQDDEGIFRLNLAVEPSKLYSGYNYRSSVSKPFVDHCEALAKACTKFNPSVVLDIGGNDGCLLNAFTQPTVSRKINVDGCGDFQPLNEANGIVFEEAFWPNTKEAYTADLILSTNVFQHTEGYKNFLQGVSKTLTPGGHWVLEFPYFYDTVKTLQFDQVYHEHFYYWTVTSLQKAASQYGLTIVDIQRVKIHGGSLRVVFTKPENSKRAQAKPQVLSEYLAEEKQVKWEAFHQDTNHFIAHLARSVKKLQGTTAAFGAAAKGTVFLNALEAHSPGIAGTFQHIIDDTPTKQGKWMPGVGLEVLSLEQSQAWGQDQKNPIENIVVLAHNFYPYIYNSLRARGFEGNILNLML